MPARASESFFLFTKSIQDNKLLYLYRLPYENVTTIINIIICDIYLSLYSYFTISAVVCTA